MPRFALLVGEHVFAVDDETMESATLALMRARGLSLGLAESVTGGLVAGRLTARAGRQRCAARRRSSRTPAR